MKTLISLFSSAGVGDYGFKLEGFETIATNELLPERIAVQKLNKKCRYESGYVNSDIKLESTKQQIMDEISFWEHKHKINNVDVVVATPPCQGMSTANFKKKNEMPRNSLVIESISLVSRIKPRYFIFENVRSFLKTMCQDTNGDFKTIKDAIQINLGEDYNIHTQIINFKDYGVPSSRPRTIVIGTRKDLTNLSPLLVFPNKEEEIPLSESIRKLSTLKKFNEYEMNDPLHMFREYPGYMREWISGLLEGQDAFNYSSVKPYKIIGDEKIQLKGKHLGNKFSRMYWNKPAPAIHTRSDQLASNRTIHPSDDRVLSIRELMVVMTIPKSFKWFSQSEFEAVNDKVSFLRKKELNIRRSIGEAVPTLIFRKIAKNIKNVDEDPYQLFYKLQYESDRMAKNAAFYTPQSVIFNIIKNVNIKKNNIKILEPSSGWGTFLPQIIKKFQDKNNVEITLMDIDQVAIEKGKKLFRNIKISKNIKIIWKVGNFLEDKIGEYDLIVGNPPYKKIGNKNLYNLFLNKASRISSNIAFVIPKTILNSDSDLELRNEILSKKYVNSITEFGVRTFNGVHIETIAFSALSIKTNKTIVERYFGKSITQEPKYIFLDKIWIPYRDKKFDILFKNIEFDIFKPYRDRQLTNKYLSENGKIRIVKSKNLVHNRVINISSYDKYCDDISAFTVKKYLNKKIIIIPNFTYNMRAALLPKKSVGNGSIVFMEPKNEKFNNFKNVLKLFNSDDFNHYYAVLQSFSKFTINVNKTIAYYMGVSNEENK